jgi:mannose-6-phosphate isomerase-like protein (cupin superfamily)
MPNTSPVPPEKVNLKEKFGKFDDLWQPKIVAELNDHHVKIVKVSGSFVWHRHEAEDELFLVTEGRLTVQFRDREVVLVPGELLVVPRGVEHRPVAEEVTHVLLLEPKTTVNTGSAAGDRTVDPEWI